MVFIFHFSSSFVENFQRIGGKCIFLCFDYSKILKAIIKMTQFAISFRQELLFMAGNVIVNILARYGGNLSTTRWQGAFWKPISNIKSFVISWMNFASLGRIWMGILPKAYIRNSIILVSHPLLPGPLPLPYHNSHSLMFGNLLICFCFPSKLLFRMSIIQHIKRILSHNVRTKETTCCEKEQK